VLGTRSFAALAVVGVLAVAGCGGGDGSKSDVESKVNDICKDFNAKAAKLQKATDLKSFAKEGRKLVPEIQRTGNRLGTVKASEDVRKKYGDDYTKFVQNFVQTSAVFGSLLGFAEAGNQTAFNQASKEFDRLDKEGDRLAKKLSFDDCVSS
jgi:outer membrane murein-binding lipoprotein Lpp